MADLPTMPVMTDALLGDTSHLDDAEFGAYMRILVTMWRNGGWLRADLLRSYTRHGPKQWARAWDKLAPFFRDFDAATVDAALTASDGRRRQKTDADQAARAEVEATLHAAVEPGRITQKRLLSLFADSSRGALINSQRGAEGGKAKALKSRQASLLEARTTHTAVCSNHEPSTMNQLREENPQRSRSSVTAPRDPAEPPLRCAAPPLGDLTLNAVAAAVGLVDLSSPLVRDAWSSLSAIALARSWVRDLGSVHAVALAAADAAPALVEAGADLSTPLQLREAMQRAARSTVPAPTPAPDFRPPSAPPADIAFDPGRWTPDRATIEDVAARVCEACGGDPAKDAGWACVDLEVTRWLMTGVERGLTPDAAASVIVATARRKTGKPPRSPTYFAPAIADAFAAHLAPMPTGAAPDADRAGAPRPSAASPRSDLVASFVQVGRARDEERRRAGAGAPPASGIR